MHMSQNDKKLPILSTSDIATVAEYQIEFYDSQFTKLGLPLHQRPLASTIQLLKDGAQGIDTQSLSKYMDEPWFAEIVLSIKGWYERQYGIEAVKPAKSQFSGLVILRGMPTPLLIPETVKRVEVEYESSWMIYADAIHESESYLTFFVSKPNLDSLTGNSRNKLQSKISKVVSNTRRINLALKSASNLTPDGERLRDSIWVHIDSAVGNICTLKSALISAATWELHLAVEKTLKVFLLQKGHTGVKGLGHDIGKICEEAKTKGLACDPKKISKLPHWKVSSNARYGENHMEVSNAASIYDAALDIMAETSEKIDRTIILNNGGFLLKKPRWV